MEKRVIFVPHYKESFKTLLSVAQYVRSSKLGIPYFIIYFEDNLNVKKVLEENNIDFIKYNLKSFTKISLIDKFIRIIVDMNFSLRLINSLSPVQAMICATESNRLEYALIAVLNRRKINTIVLQWAMTGPEDYECRSRSEPFLISKVKNCAAWLINKIFKIKFAKGYGTGDAKFFAVMGEHYLNMFHSQGISKKKLVLTGHPEQDYLYELSRNIKNPDFKRAALESFGLDAARPLWIVAREAVVCFKLLSEEKDKQDLCSVLEILSKYHPNVQIVLKLHPRDIPEHYEFVRQKFPFVSIIYECDLYRLIAACDLYISQISSTMMWAIALDKPVISYDFNNQPGWHYFRNREGIIKADAPEELAEKIRNVSENGLNSEVFQLCQVAKKKYMCLDGKACERIGNLIVQDN